MDTWCIGAKYKSGDPIQKVLAMSCMAPYFFIASSGAIAYSRRNWRLVLVFVGYFCNAGITSLLKSVMRHPRPNSLCKELSICHKYGMPSSHASIMAYTLGIYTFLMKDIPEREISSLHRLEFVSLASLTVLVAVARVELGYHTPGQVIAGLLLGFLFNLLWQTVIVKLAGFHVDIFCKEMRKKGH